MSTPAAPNGEGFDVVVGADGARGALAGVIDAQELDAFEVALDNSKAERIRS